MAYNIRWKIKFVALNQDSYRIEVLENGYSGTAIELRGSSDPIDTKEDNSDDPFTSIRKQTGFLRIADNGYDMDGNAFDYTDMIPSDIFDFQVRLYKEGSSNTLRWIGYIRPDALTSRLFETISIREFQLVCPIGALYEVPVSFSNNKNNLGTIKTMGQILHMALSTLGVSWDTVYKQNNVQSRADLNAKVSLINFLSENKPTHTTPSSGDIDAFTATWSEEGTSWGNVLEEVCKFWGWTLQSRALDIYLMARAQDKYFTSFAFVNLTSESTSTPTDIPQININLNNLSYASKNHTEVRRQGYRNIKIEADVNNHATVMDPDMIKMEMSYWPVASDPDQIIHISGNYDPDEGKDVYYYVLKRLGTINGQQNISTNYIDNYQIYENRQLQTSTLIAPFVIHYTDGVKGLDFTIKTEFNLDKGIACWRGGQSGGLNFFMKTLDDICLPLYSVLCIDAKAALSWNPDPDYPDTTNTAPPYNDNKPILENRTITIALRIGDKYWDNTNNTWTTTHTTFNLVVRTDGSVVSPVNTFTTGGFNPTGILFDDHNGSAGFCIYNNASGISGRMKLYIYATPGETNTYQTVCVLNSLKVSIYNADSKWNPTNKDRQEYKDIASTNFHNNLSVSLKMASGNKNTYGIGQLLTNNLSLLTSVPFRTGQSSYTNQIPENRLLAAMKYMFDKISVQSTIDVLDDMQADTPRTIFGSHWSSDRVFRLLSCNHKWREGKMELTLIAE